MPKGYRKIKYFTEEEANRFCRDRNDENRRTNMAGSRYDTEELPEGWVVNHYVIGQLCDTHVKNGMMPSDFDPDYLEGYIKNNP